MNSKMIWFVPAGMVALGIFLLSTFLAIPIQVEGAGHLDKVEHCFAYFVLIYSFLIAYKKASLLTAKKANILLVLTSTYGFSLELAQYVFFPDRFFEWLDALANVSGAVIGFLIFKLFNRG